jgi:hypothetical protein
MGKESIRILALIGSISGSKTRTGRKDVGK